MSEKEKLKMDELLEKYGTSGVSEMLRSFSFRLEGQHKRIILEMADCLEAALEEENEVKNG